MMLEEHMAINKLKSFLLMDSEDLVYWLEKNNFQTPEDIRANDPTLVVITSDDVIVVDGIEGTAKGRFSEGRIVKGTWRAAN